MMNKTIRELEKDRIDRIKSLNLEETKQYVSNLHKKMYMSNDKDEIDLCSEKIVETFDLMDKKYLLDVYSAFWDYQLRELFDEIDMRSLRSDYLIAFNSFDILFKGNYVLMIEFETLKSLFKMYYHRYVRQSNEIDHILNELSETYDFRSEGFASYLKQEFHLKEDFHLARYVEMSIIRLVYSLKNLIEDLEKHENRFSDDYVQSQLNLIADKRKNSETTEKKYYQILDDYEMLLNCLVDVRLNYVKLKCEVLDFLSSEDGFINDKLDYYETYNYSFSPLDKEAILNDKPKFDFENLKLEF